MNRERRNSRQKERQLLTTANDNGNFFSHIPFFLSSRFYWHPFVFYAYFLSVHD